MPVVSQFRCSPTLRMFLMFTIWVRDFAFGTLSKVRYPYIAIKVASIPHRRITFTLFTGVVNLRVRFQCTLSTHSLVVLLGSGVGTAATYNGN